MSHDYENLLWQTNMYFSALSWCIVMVGARQYATWMEVSLRVSKYGSLIVLSRRFTNKSGLDSDEKLTYHAMETNGSIYPQFFFNYPQPASCIISLLVNVFRLV